MPYGNKGGHTEPSSTGRDIITAPLHWMGNVGARAMERLGVRLSDTEQVQRHLRGYVGRLMVTGSFSYGTEREQRRLAQKTAGVLFARGLIDPDITLGIRPMVAGTYTEEPTSLAETVNMLQQVIAAKYDIHARVNYEPIHCGQRRSGCGAEEICMALSEALGDFEDQTYQEGIPPELPLGFVAVTQAHYAAKALRGFHFADLEHGGVAELSSVGSKPRDTGWVAYS